MVDYDERYRHKYQSLQSENFRLHTMLIPYMAEIDYIDITADIFCCGQKWRCTGALPTSRFILEGTLNKMIEEDHTS